jgi:IS5 family transposase
MFRPILNRVFHKEDATRGGRPAYDYLMMFKILLIQQFYGIADDKTEYQINDRLSFQRFLGLSLSDRVPDAKTIWLFREKLTKQGAYKELFDLFSRHLEEQGMIKREGSIVDASFVQAPKQRNTREENSRIKEDGGKDLWQDRPNKLRQKDKDGRWVKRNGVSDFGYKNNIKADRNSKLIVDFTVTDASVHDSRELDKLVDTKDKELYADSAYVGKDLHDGLLEKNKELKIHIHEKASRNNPLTEEQKENNREKSKIRARVEHVFGTIYNSFGPVIVRSIGKARANCQIALKNLVYNMCRVESIKRLDLMPVES